MIPQYSLLNCILFFLASHVRGKAQKSFDWDGILSNMLDSNVNKTLWKGHEENQLRPKLRQGGIADPSWPFWASQGLLVLACVHIYAEISSVQLN